MSICRKR